MRVETFRRWALLVVVLAGCSDPAGPPPPSPSPPEEIPPTPPRVLVVNSLSFTLSSLDLASSEMSVQAAVAGTAANRVTRLGALLLVTSSGSNQVELFRPWSLERVGAIDLGPGSNPWTAVPTSGPRAIVTSWLSGDVRIVDTETGRVGPPLGTSRGPEGLAVTGNVAWVACTNFQGQEGDFGEGRVDVVDLAAWSVVSTIPVGRNPQEVLAAEDGRVHVLCTGNYGGGEPAEEGSVHVIDPAARAVVETIELGGSPGRLARDGAGTVWVTGFWGGVRRYREDTLEILPDPTDGTLAAAGFSGVDADPATGRVYVANFDLDLLLALDGASADVLDAWIVGDGPVDVLVVRDEPERSRETGVRVPQRGLP